MTRFARYFYPVSRVIYRPVREIAPDIEVVVPDGRGEATPADAEPMALAFLVGQESHVFVITDEGREQLLQLLTGGIVIARSVESHTFEGGPL